MKKGFTLVELSIVLVIIGLLIGGILVGKSLIESAKISSEVTKIQQYSIAIVNFRQKFKQEAGDSNLFSPAGNNDKDTLDTSGACSTTRNYEAQSAWSHLSQANLLSKNYQWSASVYCAAAVVSGKYKALDNLGPTYFPDNSSVTSTDYLYSYNYSQGVPFAFLSGGKNYNRTFQMRYDPYIVWGLENKLDDGVVSMTTGMIQSQTTVFGLGAACTPDNVASSRSDCAVTIFWAGESLDKGIY